MADVFEGRYPELEDFFDGGGLPGVEYALVLAQDALGYEGYEAIVGMTPFSVSGPDGTATCTLLGKGQPIKGADKSNGVRVYEIAGAVDEATGLTPKEDPAPKRGPGRPRKETA